MVELEALTDTEGELRRAALEGEWYEPGGNPEVRAEVLSLLLAGREGYGTVSPHWKGAANLQVTGRLHLGDATASSIRLHRCLFSDIDAEGMNIRGDLKLMHCQVAGQLRLAHAHIGGDLDLTGTTIHPSDGPAVIGGRLQVDQDMYFGTGFGAYGEVQLFDGFIGGKVELTGAEFENPQGVALSAERLQVGKNVYCGKGFKSMGEFRIHDSQIGGNVDLTGGHFLNEARTSIYADRLQVLRDLKCGNGFRSSGTVRLLGARVGGQVDLTHGEFNNPDEVAIFAESLHVDHDMFCGADFKAQGEVRLATAYIGGRLELTNATFEAPGGTALDAAGIAVKRDLNCGEGFSATGSVSFPRVQIGGDFKVEGSVLPTEKSSMNLWGANIGGELKWRPTGTPLGTIDLRNVTVKNLSDDCGKWPPHSYELHGFTYQGLEGNHDRSSIKQRVNWLRRSQDKYTPQIYNQLAQVYRSAGNEDAARDVLVEKQKARRQAYRDSLKRKDSCFGPGNDWKKGWPSTRNCLSRGTRRIMSWLGGQILRLTIDYGYRPLRILWWLAVLLVGGSVLFQVAHPSHLLPRDPKNPADFYAPLYTLDLLLPVANLHQRDLFVPDGFVDWCAAAFTVSGWLLAAILVAGLSGVFKRD